MLLRRISRTNLLTFVVVANLGITALDFFVLHSLGGLFLNFGVRLDALVAFRTAPLWRIGIEAAYDVVLIILAVARLHDFGKPGWWLAILAALPLAGAVGLGTAPAMIALIGWLAMFFWPGDVGPNAFGPDPRGWQSREHFEQQQRALKEQR